MVKKKKESATQSPLQDMNTISKSTVNPLKQTVTKNVASKRSSTICSTKVLTQKKNNNFTPPIRNVRSTNSKAACSKENLKKVSELGKNVLRKNSTPVNKLDKSTRIIPTSSDTKTTTPPIQSSVSPEINCASLSSLRAVTETPVCYGAGHIVSGVADGRKCRARGVLIVGQKGSGCINLNEIENGGKSTMSLVPFPAEASMQWLLSPCEEVDECRNSKFSESCIRGNASSASLRKTTLLSPSRSPGFEGISRDSSGEVHDSPLSGLYGKKVRKNRYNSIIESSPFSGDSLGSGNVIQTPEMESSPDRRLGMTCLNASVKRMYDFEYDINCVTEDPLRSSMSPKIDRSIWGSPDFSFHLPSDSPSDSTDLSPSLNTCTNGCSYASNSRPEEISVSHSRVSWIDGLASRIFEMDESDICRCLSDDESDFNRNSNGKLKSCFSREMKENIVASENCEKEVASPEFVDNAPKYNEEREKDSDMKRSNPCEESMYTDGGGLAASGDSDWTSCYKNQLFKL